MSYLILASKRERKQYNKRSNKQAKTSLKNAVTLLASENKTTEKTNNADIVNYSNNYNTERLESSPKSPSPSLSSSSISDDKVSQNDSIVTEDDIKSVDDFVYKITDKESFVNKLLKIEDEKMEMLEKYLKETGLVRNFFQGFQMKREFNESVNFTNVNKNFLKQSFVDFVDSECQCVISWARKIEDFDQLTLEDQTSMIEQNFLEVILIGYIWRSIEKSSSTNEICFSVNEYCTLNRSMCKEIGIVEVYDHFVLIAAQLRKIGITRDEYICLKVLTLFKSCYNVETSEKKIRLREKCFMSLRKVTNESCRKQDFRYDSYLMLLSEMKMLSIQLMSCFSNFQNDCKIEVPNLLSDMCFSQCYNSTLLYHGKRKESC